MRLILWNSTRMKFVDESFSLSIDAKRVMVYESSGWKPMSAWFDVEWKAAVLFMGVEEDCDVLSR